MIASYALLSVKSLYNRLSPPPLHPPPLSARHTNIPYGQQHKLYLQSNVFFSFVQIHYTYSVVPCLVYHGSIKHVRTFFDIHLFIENHEDAEEWSIYKI